MKLLLKKTLLVRICGCACVYTSGPKHRISCLGVAGARQSTSSAVRTQAHVHTRPFASRGQGSAQPKSETFSIGTGQDFKIPSDVSHFQKSHEEHGQRLKKKIKEGEKKEKQTKPASASAPGPHPPRHVFCV